MVVEMLIGTSPWFVVYFPLPSCTVRWTAQSPIVCDLETKSKALVGWSMSRPTVTRVPIDLPECREPVKKTKMKRNESKKKTRKMKRNAIQKKTVKNEMMKYYDRLSQYAVNRFLSRCGAFVSVCDE